MKLQDGDIIPGVGIGNIKLGITREELIDRIGEEYQEQLLFEGSILRIENARFWIANDGRVDQIGAGKEFHGKYADSIGLGSTLDDVRKHVGNFVAVCDTYELEDVKGICFELEDVDDWEELTAPIEYIYVFRVHQHTESASNVP